MHLLILGDTLTDGRQIILLLERNLRLEKM